MRIKEKSIENLIKGHVSAEIINSFMEVPTPFENGEKMVLTGSAIPYYLWHTGKSDNYLYKPPSDLDLVLSTPPQNEKSIKNISIFRDKMQQAAISAVNQAGFKVSYSNTGRYDNTLSIQANFTPEQVNNIIRNSRMMDVLNEYGAPDFMTDKPVEIKTTMDMMVLDNTVLSVKKFDHPNAEESVLRHQALSASLAFKIARCTLRRGFEQSVLRPGDVIDAHNIFNAHGYNHEPDLLHAMTVVALALQVPPSFDKAFYTGELLHRNVNELREALSSHYSTRFSISNTEKIINSWEKIVNSTFPGNEAEKPLLTQDEDDFIENFLLPHSGNPKESIIPELLQGTKELQDVFREHNELADKIKNSTFFQQRVSYRQISPLEIPV